jgi:hypothetical protein
VQATTSRALWRFIGVKPWLLMIATVVLTACGAVGSGSQPTPVPTPVANLIHELQTQPPANPPAYIARYEYRGGTVFYVPPRCCDIFSELYDASGQLICHPDGGIAGHGDGRCPDFLSQRTHETTLWRSNQ